MIYTDIVTFEVTSVEGLAHWLHRVSARSPSAILRSGPPGCTLPVSLLASPSSLPSYHIFDLLYSNPLTEITDVETVFLGEQLQSLDGFILSMSSPHKKNHTF